MEKSIPLYRMIYHKIANRILTGFYQKGDRLASAQKIHEQYGCSLNSVRQAMRLLQQDGFITLEERKAPVVTADPLDPQFQKLRRDNFLRRKHAHLYAYRMLAVFVPEMAWQGALRCDSQSLGQLQMDSVACIRQAKTNADLTKSIQDYLMALVRQSGNLLAGDLYFQVCGFDELRRIVLPAELLVEGETDLAASLVERLHTMIRTARREDFCWLVQSCLGQFACQLEREIYRYAPEEAASDTQITFMWYVYQRPVPLYQQIAYDLLRYAQRSLSPGEYFPSEANLMQQYDVAAVTVRSALATLNGLGFARTFNGRGTQFVLEATADGEYSRLLKEYFDSMELFAASASGLAALAAPALAPKAMELLDQATAYRRRNGLCMWILEQILPLIPNQAVQNTFYQLKDRIIFGLILKPSTVSGPQIEYFEESYQQLREGLQQLAAGDTAAFGACLTSMFQHSLERSRTSLRRLCYENPQWDTLRQSFLE